jgi:lysophospholipase L1-like esterase
MVMSESDRPGKVSCLKRLLFGFLSVCLFILLAEIVLSFLQIDTYFQNRFFLVNRALDYPEVFKKDSRLFWRMRPDPEINSRFFQGIQYSINSSGLRGEDIGSRDHRIRIVTMGNSCTFGWGVELRETYAIQLERMINIDNELPPVEVINAGVPGYSSFQGRCFFESDIIGFRPDIVFLMFGWNDRWIAADNISDNEQQMPPGIIIYIQNIMSRMQIYRLLKKAWLLVIEEPLTEKLNRVDQVYRVSPDEFYENLVFIIEKCREESIIPILLAPPIPSLSGYYRKDVQSNMHVVHSEYGESLKRLAETMHVPLIDIGEKFDKYYDLYDDAENDPIHFNARGHNIAAEAIFNFFKANPMYLKRDTQ